MSMMNHTTVNLSNAGNKQSYMKPVLTEFGSVAEMTQGGTNGSRCDQNSFTSKDKGAGNC